MNEQDRRELEQITHHQKHLREELAALERRIEELNQKLAQGAPSAKPAPPPPLPDLLPVPEKKTVPPPLPARETAAPRTAPTMPAPRPPTPAKPISTPVSPNPEARSFEMRVGTHWFVRIGVVMLLTGLVFFSKYAYDHYILNFGAPGKITLLYLLSGGLLGTGFWLARSRESMRNFGNVLTAGGMAAVYYTTYAAHYVKGLQIIEDPLLAGTLLLGWSALMVGIADRKKSQTMALFAVLLAYYTSIINPITNFTLFSNLVLTAVGVFFLIRNRWAGMTYASLIATYLSYAFWRFYHHGQWIFDGQMTAGDFWNGNLFLLGYWTLFTVAVLWSKHDNFIGGRRATFLTLNNGAFFAHVVITLPLVYPGSFWKFSLLYGAVLLLLAWICRVRHPEDAAAEGSYLVQGLALTTAGIIAYFSGHTLALALAMESVILLVCGTLQNNRILKAAAYLTAPLATAFALDSLGKYDREGLWLAAGVGAAMVFNGWWVRRMRGETELVLRGKPTFFALLGLVLWMVATIQNVVPEYRAVALVIEALILTFSIYILRMPEVAVLGQFFLVLGQLISITQMDEKSVAWWSPAAVIVATLAAGHWWQHQKILASAKNADSAFQLIYAMAVVGVLYFWLQGRFSQQEWLVLTSFLSVGMLFYGIVTRAWFLALLGQFFLLISGVQFISQIAGSHSPPFYVTLVPIATVLGTGLIVRALVRDPSRTATAWDPPVLWLTRIYRWTSMVMFILWVFEYVPTREQFWSFSLAGFLLYLWGASQKNGTRLAISGILSAVGLFIFLIVTHGGNAVYWPNFLACLLILAQQRIGKSLLEGENTPAKAAFPWLIAGGVIGLWVFVSRWVMLDFRGFSLTATWAIYALAIFAAGFLLKERAYRLLGLAILTCSLGKVVIIDVWKLEQLSRIVSFTVLGLVLLLLGFVYNRFQEKIKSWL